MNKMKLFTGWLVLIMGGFVSRMGLTVFGWLLSGFAISKLWLWFISEPFGIAPIGIAHAIGFDILLSYICTTAVPKAPENEAFFKEYMNSIGFTIIVFLLGWIVHLFM